LANIIKEIKSAPDRSLRDRLAREICQPRLVRFDGVLGNSVERRAA
jgi:hypothetical protein